MKERTRKEIKEIMDYALAYIGTLPYPPSLRHVFYKLMLPFGLEKEEYKERITPCIARRRRWEKDGWKPDSLVDDTRQPAIRGGGYDDEEDWVKSFLTAACTLDVRRTQKNIVEVWYEAEAMSRQFEYYLAPLQVTTVPFKGDFTIEPKHRTAKRLESYAHIYPDKPIVVLYFGDCDKKGKTIPESALKDIRRWCSVPFKFVLCGLTKEQAERLNLLENFEKPGVYQWEAVSDKDAGKMILSNVRKYWDEDIIKEMERLEAMATKNWQKWIKDAMEGLD